MPDSNSCHADKSLIVPDSQRTGSANQPYATDNRLRLEDCGSHGLVSSSNGPDRNCQDFARFLESPECPTPCELRIAGNHIIANLRRAERESFFGI